MTYVVSLNTDSVLHGFPFGNWILSWPCVYVMVAGKGAHENSTIEVFIMK